MDAGDWSGDDVVSAAGSGVMDWKKLGVRGEKNIVKYNFSFSQTFIQLSFSNFLCFFNRNPKNISLYYTQYVYMKYR